MATDPSSSSPPSPTPPSTEAPAPLRCTSEIVSVVVHGRGARVTRRVTPPQGKLPEGRVDLLVPGVTMRAQKRGVSVKLAKESRYALLNVRGDLHVPQQDEGPGEPVKRVEELEREREAIDQELALLRARRSSLSGRAVRPARHIAWREYGPLDRMMRAMELSDLLGERLASFDAGISALEQRREALERELASLYVDAAQRTRTSLQGEGHPTRAFLVGLVGSGGALDPFELTYIIESARWWPAYTLRLHDEGKRAKLAMDAHITQDSGEDWEKVRIALSTANLDYDATLPTLPALKLGKRQPPARTGYREAPQGLERLFVAHDAAQLALIESRREQKPVPPPPLLRPSPALMPAKPRHDAPADVMLREEADADEFGAPPPQSLSYGAADLEMQDARAMPVMRKSAGPASMLAGLFDGIGGGGAPPGAAPSAPPAPMRSRGSADMERSADKKKRALLTSQDAFGDDDDAQAIAPATDWLDFDALELGGEQAGALRGKLQPRPRPHAMDHGSLHHAQERSQALSLIDPMATRGHYDHRFDSDSLVDIPSDGMLHRVEMTQAEAEAKLVWRAVPLEREEVFRLARITNPLSAPLLAGPMEVFASGSFLLSTPIQHVDRGADIEIGLGIDERLRIARNVRTEEEQLGLLGGKTAIDHVVTIELTSNLGFPAEITVVDRVPITSAEHIEVQEIDHTPSATPYTQRDREQPIKGGRLWKVALAPGAKQTLTSHYRITLSSKEELVGGNRRG